MDSKKTTNVLLLVIAVCLTLIALKLPGTSFISEAQAQSSAGQNVRLMGCYKGLGSLGCDWTPVRVSGEGMLLTSKNQN